MRFKGVKIVGRGVKISRGCRIGKGVTLYAPCRICDKTQICDGATIYPFCYLAQTYVGRGATVYSSTLIGAQVGENCRVGPYAYLRDGAKIGDGCRIGAFVEVKNSEFGTNSNAAHLSYIGDADIGGGVNLGCGVVFANYDGKTKNRSSVGDGAFIGCNCNLVAPVTVGSGAYVAAGTTLTENLSDGDFCVGRAREYVKKGAGRGRYDGR